MIKLIYLTVGILMWDYFYYIILHFKIYFNEQNVEFIEINNIFRYKYFYLRKMKSHDIIVFRLEI